MESPNKDKVAAPLDIDTLFDTLCQLVDQGGDDETGADTRSIFASLLRAVSSRQVSLPDEDRPLVLFFGGIFDWTGGKYYHAWRQLNELTKDHPEVTEFNAVWAYFLAEIGHFEPAIYHYKLALAGKDHPRLKGWVPASLGDFNDRIKASEPDFLYFRALRLYSVGQFKVALSMLLDAAMIEPDRKDIWRRVVELNLLQGEFYDSYAASLALLKGDSMGLEDMRTLLMSLVSLQAWGSVFDLTKGLKSEDQDYDNFFRMAALVASNNGGLNGGSVKGALGSGVSGGKTGGKKGRKLIRKSPPEVFKLAVIAGQLFAGQGNSPFLSLMDSLNATYLDHTMYYFGPRTHETSGPRLEDILTGWNFHQVNPKTASRIFKNENPDALIDVDQLAMGHAFSADTSAPCYGFAIDQGLAKSLGYRGVIGCRHLYPKSSPDDIMLDDGWHLPVTMLANQDIVSNLQPDGLSSAIHLALPGDADFAQVSKFLNDLDGKVKNLLVIIDARFHGGSAAVDRNIALLQVSDNLRSRCLVLKDASAGFGALSAGLSLDISGSVNMSQTYSALSQGVPVLTRKREHARERLSLAMLRHDGLGDYVYDSYDALSDQVLAYLKDKKLLRQERLKLVKHYLDQDRDAIGRKRVVALLDLFVSIPKHLSQTSKQPKKSNQSNQSNQPNKSKGKP